jgi:NADPH:quinone reductase-like Zn-dependent oxidoreductase
MKTITYARFGSPDVLTLSDADSPSPRSGHLVVRVRAVSINPLDGKIRRGDARLLSGARFPKTPGLDFAGVVEAVGPGVSGFQPGDDVFGGPGSLKEGYLSERISVPARVVAKLPKSLGYERAAVVILQASAAALEALGRKLEAGALRPGPTRVFELSEFRRAFEVAEQGGLVGKVVIRLGG